MCTVSMVMDHYGDGWRRQYWPTGPQTGPFNPSIIPPIGMPTQREVDEFRRLLERAREYDRRNGEPDCELDEKRQMLKQMAAALGVDISFVDVAAPSAVPLDALPTEDTLK